MKLIVIFMAITCAALILSGCVSYTTLQSARPIDPGEVDLDAGTAVFPGKRTSVIPEVGVRAGVARNFDMGAKFNFTGVLSADGKVQFIEKPLRVSADFGWSYFGLRGDINSTTVAFYPSILVGEDHWYAGVRQTYETSSGTFNIFGPGSFSSDQVSTNIVLGGSIGDKVRVLPEINIYFREDEKPFIVPALGFQFVL